jgi:hypothetical protein
MRHAWVNSSLLVLLVAQLATGYFGLVNGLPAFGWVLWLHGIIGYTILVAFIWKGQIIADVLGRRRLTSTRLAFAAMTILTLVVIFTGLVWTTGGFRYWLGTSLITVHALLAVALVLLWSWHVVARRYILRIPRARDRRAFLRLALLNLGGLALWQAARSAKGELGLPGAGRRFTGSYRSGSQTGTFPTVSWLFDNPDPIDGRRWRLVVDGAVERPLVLDYDQVLRASAQTLSAVIDCTGGWYSAQEWSGIGMGHLLALAGPKPTARSVSIQAVSGYARRFPMLEAATFLLATQVAGQPLGHGHGFPLRLVAPGHRGYDWVKWVVRVHINETGALDQPPLPLQ